MTRTDLLNKLYKECGLSRDDVFDSGQYKIITRTGIEKIQYKNEIIASFEVVVANLDQVVISGTFWKMDETFLPQKKIQTFGEWNKSHIKTTKDGKQIPFYSVALAEKRCLSRGVLKIMGYYEHGFLGEDETIYDDGGLEDATPEQVEYIESLLRTSTYDERGRTKIESEIYGLTEKKAKELISNLLGNQVDALDGPAYGQKDIQSKLKLISNE